MRCTFFDTIGQKYSQLIGAMDKRRYSIDDFNREYAVYLLSGIEKHPLMGGKSVCMIEEGKRVSNLLFACTITIVFGDFLPCTRDYAKRSLNVLRASTGSLLHLYSLFITDIFKLCFSFALHQSARNFITLTIYTNCLYNIRWSDPDYQWSDLAGPEFSKAINDAYNQVVHWKLNLFWVPLVL